MTITDLNSWLNEFVDRVPGVTHAVAVSGDGLLIGRSRRLPRDEADRVAAIAAGLVSLLRGAAKHFRAGSVVSNMTELEGGFMFTVSAATGASLLALAGKECDIGAIGHELTRLLNRMAPRLADLDQPVASSALTPEMA
ncbi:MAG TPA: roadblock/LC7 domain-containing protein [Natronosporangium sp.]